MLEKPLSALEGHAKLDMTDVPDEGEGCSPPGAAI